MMNLKSACRLCCSQDGVSHELFSQSEGGASLAEEIFSFINIQITKEDELSDSICGNCYRVNTFFKEFKENCSQVNDYLKKRSSGEDEAQDRTRIKTEKEDDYVDRSVFSGDGPDGDNAGLHSNSDTPYPVALRHSSNTENLDELRSNFLAVKRAREGERRSSAVAQRENTLATEETTPQRREKRRLEDVDAVTRKRRAMMTGSYDYLNHVVKQEEVDIYDSPVEDSTDARSLEDPMSPQPAHFANDTHSVASPSPSDPGEDSCSSSSCASSDTDDDIEMVMLLALLL